MENKSTGKTVTLIMLLIIIGLGGYIVYNKNITNNKTEKLKSDINSLKNEIEMLKNEKATNDTTKNNSIVGYYKTGSMINSEKIDNDCIKGTKEIFLSENGTFKSAYSTGCDGAKQSGTYKQENDKIILTCDSTSEQCPEGTTKEYTLNNDGSISNIPTDNSANIETYKKIESIDLELLNK